MKPVFRPCLQVFYHTLLFLVMYESTKIHILFSRKTEKVPTSMPVIPHKGFTDKGPLEKEPLPYEA